MRKFLFVLMFTIFTPFLFSQYTIETPITGLVRPVAFSFLPNGNVIMTHKAGPVRIYTLGGAVVSTFWNFTDSCNSVDERGTLGICIDPNYAVNHYVYVFYIHLNPQGIRVVRFTENNNLGTNPLIVFNYPTGTLNGNHVGGNIRFGPDDKLYITIGETGISSNAQLLTNPRGKILRINSNGTIPTDNPYYDDGNPSTNNDDRIWAYGLRNSFDFCFSPVNDSLYASENGSTIWDEINFIRKGKNYGWPVCEGYCNPYNPAYRQPMHVIGGSPLPGVTGIMIYSSTVMPDFNGKLLFGDNNYGRLFSCTLGNAPFYDTITARTQVFDLDGLTTLMQGPDNYIYALNGGYTTTGKLYRIRPSITGIGNNHSIPDGFELRQNFPNPFNPKTIINYQLAMSKDVKLVVYDVMGKEIAVLVNQKQNAGTHEVEWNASNYPSGVYFYSLTAGDFTAEKKMVLLK
ncbi:MAG: T9SS C-terminal target domain-containing protein [Ignavibacteriae bacterium]|nr:MAG: T9SS C-terminal target domain-containing protein [Ignavibacteriota bacterium]